MRRTHFYKRNKEPVVFSWTLFLIASLQVSVWSFGVWEHPFQQFLVNFQHNVKGERPNNHLSYKPLASLTQQLIELHVLRQSLHSGALRSAETPSSLRSPPKLESRAPESAQELALRALYYNSREDSNGNEVAVEA
mmetsp:Transcript_33364/g.81010  ORF Transcript_33364/g.81010 Transcript_33364/m.81010 type:complete len:136 (+) Transcript_33364:191-598(+)